MPNKFILKTYFCTSKIDPMELSHLNAISPIDGRYRNKVEELAQYFSEHALIKYRVKVEILYFIALCKIPLPQLKEVTEDQIKSLHEIYTHFSETDAEEIKETEKVTNHDVKAVEYFIKKRFDDLNLSSVKEFIHFGLTSQDINNTANPLMIKEAVESIIQPQIEKEVELLDKLASDWDKIPLLARTHGQPATPTRLGKEILVFTTRVKEQLDLLSKVPHAAKFGGATGGFNAHYVAYTDIDWHQFGDTFISKSLGLKRSSPTTQIEHYDHLAALFDNLKRINTIFIDLSRDVWQYISVNYFKQKINKDEIGSSAMPHKVNPIDFENAEGNLGIANALFEHLSIKLPISRLQRDLTDSTVLRNVGVPLAHTLIALKSLDKGIHKLEVNENAINQDLEDNWAVVAEAIQTILRREGYPKPYEALKALTRTGDKITKESIQDFIGTLEVNESVKAELLNISPYNYTGK